MNLEARITTAVLADLCLSALEDATNQHVLNVPGLHQPVRRGLSMRERRGELTKGIAALSAVRPDAATQLSNLENSLLELLSARPELDLAKWWVDFSSGIADADGTSHDRLASFEAHFEVSSAPNGGVLLLRERASSTEAVTTIGTFVARVTAMCAAYRTADTRRFYPADRLALLRAYQLVETGDRPTPPMQPIRTDPLRSCPTYLSFADPGQGHLWTTVKDKTLLRGTIVHIETIDREGIADPKQVEAYRIPSIRDVARIRVHVGDTTPTSVYVGRPVFEGLTRTQLADPAMRRTFQHSLLKAAHTVAAACSGLFSLGVSECKIGLDGLTARQAIDYMQALAGNVIRDRFTQRLSAAFNVNTPLLDDRDERRDPQEVSGRVKVAKLGIILTKQGGFEKVTWDGAATGESLPIVGQLKRTELFELVHEAHERGLETYISAGMTEEHMPVAVEIGVGGVGIGTKLHATTENGTITYVLPERVRAVLNARDRALRRPAGQAAATLAQLDWRHANSPLSPEQNAQRSDLYSHLHSYHAAADTQSESGGTVRLQLAEDELQESLTRTTSRLGDLLRPQSSPMREPHGGVAGVEDPIFTFARQILEREARSHETLSPDAQIIRRLVDERDAEGLRRWFGA